LVIYSEESLLSIIEEKNNNYVITNDNFKKMVLLIYRIIANIPVIIMGDTGCGKTSLITKLNQILNGGKTTLKIINIHPGITDEMLFERIDEANKESENLKNDNKDLWVFFDEMNICNFCPFLCLKLYYFFHSHFHLQKKLMSFLLYSSEYLLFVKILLLDSFVYL